MSDQTSVVAARWKWQALLGCVALIIWCSGTAAGVPNASAVVSVEFVPTSVPLPAIGKGAQVTLVLRNPTRDKLTVTQIDVFPEPFDQKLIIDFSPSTVVPPENDHAWLVRLPDSLPYPAPTKLFARISYRTHAEKGDSPSRLKIATAVLELPQRALETVESVATGTFVTPIEKLTDGQTAQLYISVTNKSSTAIKVTSIASADVSSFSIKQKTPNFPVVIEPGTTALFPSTLKAKTRVKPGKASLLMNVSLKWGTNSHGNLVLSKEVTLGVIGESDILTAVGVPSLLLLPGYLIIVAFAAIGVRKQSQTTFEKWNAIAKPEVLVLAVTLCWLMKLLYPWMPFSTGRDYTELYGLADIIVVWFMSVIIGASAAVVIRLGIMIYEGIAWLMTLKVPTEQDSAWTTLVKLGKRHQPLLLPSLPDPAQPSAKLFQIDARSNWVAPEIVIRGSTAAQLPEAATLENLLNDRTCSARAMVSLLKSAQQKHGWTVEWKVAGRPVVNGSLQFNPARVRSIITKEN